jgi:hypothetical protein
MAFKIIGDQKQLKSKSLDDRELEQLWAEIGRCGDQVVEEANPSVLGQIFSASN